MASIKGTQTEKNILKAFAGESQARNRYTFYSGVAKKEGLVQISAIFEETANQEKEHAKRLFKLLEGGVVEITDSYPAGIIGTTLDNLKAAAAGENLAGLMITYPSTNGIFEAKIKQIVEIIHRYGGMVYMDGANMNALLGIARPGDLGFDVMHFNLHKTFATPHGGGGPGSGPICAKAFLADYIPGPVACILEEETEELPPLYGLKMPEESMGQVRSFWGHFGVMVKAYVYILMEGEEGLRRVSEFATLNANYLMAALKKVYPLPFDRPCMHEFVLEGKLPNAPEVRALDIAKRLMDYKFHPPTNYFPLIVHEALMIEPTETENKQVLDEFIEALLAIAKEAEEDPQLLHDAPLTTPFGRMDEVKAAKDLILTA